MVSLTMTLEDQTQTCMGCTLIVHDGKKHRSQKTHDVTSIEHLKMVAPAGHLAA